jgi:DNA-binding MarR family transcriptional regulator
VQRLERAGLVSRTPNVEDGRSVIIAATPHSETLRAQVWGVWSELEAATVGEMSATEQAGAVEALERLATRLAASDSSAVPRSAERGE